MQFEDLSDSIWLGNTVPLWTLTFYINNPEAKMIKIFYFYISTEF